MLDREPPRRPDPERPAAPAVVPARATGSSASPASRCDATAARATCRPPRVCVKCRAVDQMVPERLADVQGHHRHLHRRPAGLLAEPARRGRRDRLRRRRPVPVRAHRRRPGHGHDRRPGRDDVPAAVHRRRRAQLLLEGPTRYEEERTDGIARHPRPGRDRRHGVHALRRALGQGRRRPARSTRPPRRSASAGVKLDDIDAFWLGTMGSGISGLTLSRPLKIDYKPVTRLENMCATGSEAFRNACYAVASGAYRHGHGRRRREAEGLGLLRPHRQPRRRATAPSAVDHRAGHVLAAGARLRQEVRRRRGRDEGRAHPHRVEEPPERRAEPAGAVQEGSGQGGHLQLAADRRPARHLRLLAA